MDQIEEIMQKSIELGKSISHTPIYRLFKQTEYDLLYNSEARKLIEDLQKLKQEHYGKKAAGIELTKAEEDYMVEMENKCLSDRQILLSNDANTKFQEFMGEISKYIKDGLMSAK